MSIEDGPAMLEYTHQFIGNYRLLKLLKQDEFVQVYLGEDQHNHVQVAIKILDTHAHLTKSDADKILMHAGRIMSRLDHPNIVHLYDLGEQVHGGDEPHRLLYLVTSYGANGSVRQRYPEGLRIPFEIIIAYINQSADALDYAHAQNILHARLKPENILLGASNKVLLSDFGFADSPSFPFSSQFALPLSSVIYMAPEQIYGKPQIASDQYALGIMVYEWLSGKPPFTGSAQDILIQHVEIAPAPLRSKLPHLSPLLEEVIMTALAKDPKQRFATVTGFANALEHGAGMTKKLFA